VNAFELFFAELQTIETFDLPQLGEGQREDYRIEVLCLRAAWSIEAHDDLFVFVVERGQPPTSCMSILL
jgi:hypothetical protein